MGCGIMLNYGMHTISLSVDAVSVGILIATLAIWAQLWQFYAERVPPERFQERQRIITISLTWIYAGISFGILAFTLSIIDFGNSFETIKNSFVKISFLTSLLMGLTSVVESTFALAAKWGSGKTHYEKRGISESDYRKSFRYIMSVAGLILLGSTISILVSSLIGVLIWGLALVMGLKQLSQIMNPK